VQKAFELAKSFSKPAISALTDSQKGRVMCCTFFKRELFIGNKSGGFENPAKLALVGFQKHLVQRLEICYPMRAKDLNSPVLKSFQQFKSFCC
jgi:hypothetical protein